VERDCFGYVLWNRVDGVVPPAKRKLGTVMRPPSRAFPPRGGMLVSDPLQPKRPRPNQEKESTYPADQPGATTTTTTTTATAAAASSTTTTSTAAAALPSSESIIAGQSDRGAQPPWASLSSNASSSLTSAPATASLLSSSLELYRMNVSGEDSDTGSDSGCGSDSESELSGSDHELMAEFEMDIFG
jgi:hypothetical protein